jgi:hypothetical protein
MIIIPELSFAIIDGTAPHVLDPFGNDHLVDMFSCINTEIVHENEDPIKSIEKEYAGEIGKAREVYRKIKELNDELKQFYTNANSYLNTDKQLIVVPQEVRLYMAKNNYTHIA